MEKNKYYVTCMKAEFKLFDTDEYGELKLLSNSNLLDNIDIGLIDFQVNGESIKFSSDSYSLNMSNDDGTFVMITASKAEYAHGVCGTPIEVYSFSKGAHEDYHNKIELKDINAKTLSNVSRINEFFVNYQLRFCKEKEIGWNEKGRCNKIELLSITFSDMELNCNDTKDLFTFSVDRSILDEFNNRK